MFANLTNGENNKRAQMLCYLMFLGVLPIFENGILPEIGQGSQSRELVTFLMVSMTAKSNFLIISLVRLYIFTHNTSERWLSWSLSDLCQ